ncbi:SAM-dependent methyltransferase [Micromonospora fluostatini]|uniref:SAM-dependent methyltransferase n=1 Tax=Micromonospora sp. JCM 30529 TaxID=3421643 RepID=UPI003D184F0C
MTDAPVPQRLSWAVAGLGLRPADRVLEVGCGRGVAAGLICRRLTAGRLLAVDRSPVAVREAGRRNAAEVADGRATFRVAELADLGPADGPFDRILAVDVNLFWARPAGPEYALLPRLLAPGGVVHLVHQPPHADRIPLIVGRLTGRLTAAGWAVETAAPPAATVPLCAVTARRPT